MRYRNIRFSLRKMMIGVAFVAVGLGIVNVFNSIREMDLRMSTQGGCYSSLNNLAMALDGYNQTQGHYPAPWIPSGQGSGGHSWRLAIEAYLTIPHAPELAYYDDEQPWNSDKNSRLSSKVPSWFQCPSQGNRKENLEASPFLMINDFSHAKASDIPRNAILVVEVHHANWNWLDPRDESEFLEHIKTNNTGHPSGFGVILSNCAVIRLNDPSKIKKVGAYYVVDR